MSTPPSRPPAKRRYRVDEISGGRAWIWDARFDPWTAVAKDVPIRLARLIARALNAQKEKK